MHTENELRDIFSNLASQNVLKYDDLFIALGVKTTRELEDIVIEAFYNDIIHGKLNPKLRQVEVKDWKNTSQHYNLDHMSTTLEKWSQRNVSFVELLTKEAKRADETMSEDKAHNIAIGMESEKILKGLTGKKYIDVKPQHQEQNSSQKKADSGQNTRRRGTSRPKRQGS